MSQLYSVTCIFCGKKTKTKPSRFMEKYSLNYGELLCPHCNNKIGLTLNKFGEMVSFVLSTQNIKNIGDFKKNLKK